MPRTHNQYSFLTEYIKERTNYQEIQAPMATLLGLSSPLCFTFWLMPPYGNPVCVPSPIFPTSALFHRALCALSCQLQENIAHLTWPAGPASGRTSDVRISKTMRKVTLHATTKKNTFPGGMLKIPLCGDQSYHFSTRDKSKCKCLLNLYYRNKNYKPQTLINHSLKLKFGGLNVQPGDYS